MLDIDYRTNNIPSSSRSKSSKRMLNRDYKKKKAGAACPLDQQGWRLKKTAGLWTGHITHIAFRVYSFNYT
jgi:hypothetical protein